MHHSEYAHVMSIWLNSMIALCIHVCCLILNSLSRLGHISHLTMGVVALHISSSRVPEPEESRQAHQSVWPFNAARVICRYQNHLYEIIINIYEVFFLNISHKFKHNQMIHIDIGVKTVVGTQSLLWRTWLLGARRCNFTHLAVRGNQSSFAPKSTQWWYNG